MILNQIIFAILCIEASICLILLIPQGKRICQNIVQFCSAQFGGNSSIHQVSNIIVAVIGCLFIANVHTSWKHKSTDEILSDGMRIRLLVAQRDMYISGFSLFLLLLLRLVYSSLETNIKLEKNAEAMKKQAQSASEGCKRFMEENEKYEKRLRKLDEISSSDDKNVASKLLALNIDLEKELNQTKTKLNEVQSQMDVIKKQAESQSEAYMKLLDEKSNVEKQLEDGESNLQLVKDKNAQIESLKNEIQTLQKQIQDYDFMFGDQKKKDQ